MNNHIDQFKQAIEATGLELPAEIHDDGKLHRFSTNGRCDDDSGWYVLYGDGIPAGSFGCWRTGLQSTWCAKSDREISDIERHAIRHRLNTARVQREAEQAFARRQRTRQRR